MQQTSDEEVKLFSSLFAGYENAYGEYEINSKEDSGKLKGRAKTHRRGATEKDYLNHLEGVTGIGIIPLLKSDKCWFGAIDVDIKGDVKLNESLESLEQKVRRLELPLMLFSSKSGGAHLYFFAEEPSSARLIQERLKEFSSALGYEGCEVFPKQITRLKETDDGNWINLPLFGQDRSAIYEGEKMDRLAALKLCNYMRMSEANLRAFQLKEHGMFKDGPPCLQTLAGNGVTEGSRNTLLLNIAVYIKRKYPDEWQEKISEWNQEHNYPPLPDGDVNDIIKGIIKKEYNYTCNQVPLCNVCDRKKCLKRKYGVGSGEDNEEHYQLPITGLVKYIAGEDSYRWGVNTGIAMVEFTTEELLDQSCHRKKFIERLNIVIPQLKAKAFIDQITKLVDNCEIIEDPEDASEEGQLVSAIERWFLDKGSVKTSDELVKARWWQEPSSNFIYFRGQALQDYLTHQEKIKIKAHILWRVLQKRFKAEKSMLLIKGKRRRVWYIPEFAFSSSDKLIVPEILPPEEEV